MEPFKRWSHTRYAHEAGWPSFSVRDVPIGSSRSMGRYRTGVHFANCIAAARHLAASTGCRARTVVTLARVYPLSEWAQNKRFTSNNRHLRMKFEKWDPDSGYKGQGSGNAAARPSAGLLAGLEDPFITGGKILQLNFHKNESRVPSNTTPRLCNIHLPIFLVNIITGRVLEKILELYI